MKKSRRKTYILFLCRLVVVGGLLLAEEDEDEEEENIVTNRFRIYPLENLALRIFYKSHPKFTTFQVSSF